MMGGIKKYINIFGSFTEPFKCEHHCTIFVERLLADKHKQGWAARNT